MKRGIGDCREEACVAVACRLDEQDVGTWSQRVCPFDVETDLSPQPDVAVGRGVVPPVWLTLVKQPFVVVHGGRLNWLEKVFRLLAIVGAS